MNKDKSPSFLCTFEFFASGGCRNYTALSACIPRSFYTLSQPKTTMTPLPMNIYLTWFSSKVNCQLYFIIEFQKPLATKAK